MITPQHHNGSSPAPESPAADPSADPPGGDYGEPEPPPYARSRDEPDAREQTQLAVLGLGTDTRRTDTDDTDGTDRTFDTADSPDAGDVDGFGGDFDDLDDDDRSSRRRRARGGRSAGRGRKGGGAGGGAGGRGGKSRKRKRVFPQVLALSILLVFVLGAGGAGVYWARGYFAPPDFDGEGTGEAQVVIEPGQTGEQIGEMLVAEGVVASTRAFTNALRIEGGDDMRPGTYLLRQEMSADAAVALLTDPDARIGFRVTIREGLRVNQILEEVNETTEIPLEELEQVAEAPEDHLDLPEYADGRLDGYLFPDTYTLEPNVEAAEVLQKMVNRFEEVSAEIDFERRAAELGYNPQEMMAVAAIAQAEAGSAEDMPKISQVVYNRLDADMELGMDSTCFFVINDYGIALTGEQLRECQQSGSGYATYGRHGLPTGPIVSPGTDAMNAALDPEPGEWLFFVTTDPESGLTEFAETEAEFDVLVERFRQTQEAE